MIPRVYVIPFVLPAIFAAIVLAATAANGRSGRGPTMLTEREAGLTPRTRDRSIAEVWLGWSEPAERSGAWLTRDALEALGFDLSVDASDQRAESHYRRQLARRAFVAFELDGPAWQAVLAESNRDEAVAERGAMAGPRVNGSRLVPVAVDRDADALAQRYPDARTHLIAAATLRVVRFELPAGAPYIGGRLLNLDPQRIQIRAELAAELPLWTPGTRERTPYAISLMYGSRWEPWVTEVGRR